MARLEDIGKIITGNTPKTSDVLNYSSNDICFVKPSDISDGEITMLTDSEFYISEYARTKAQILPCKSILVTCIGIIGKVAINNVECAFNQQINAIVPDTSKCLTEYLAYAIQNKQKEMQDIANAPVLPILNKTQFSDIEIQLPSVESQAEVVKKMRAVDVMVSLRKQQLSKLDELVKSRFIEMFGDPIDNPKGLPVKTLKKLSTLITNGNTPKGGSENYVDKGILFLRSQNVWRNRIELDDVAYIDDATHRSLKKSSLKHKDILITKTGRINTENSSLGRAALYLGDDDSANINGHVYLVRLDGSVVPEYVVTILTSEAYRKYIRKVCVGGIDKRQINLDQVEDFPIILPPIDLQQQFATFVERTDKSKATIQKSLEKLETLKKVLMQKYFG